jgi:hypothetical protein
MALPPDEYKFYFVMELRSGISQLIRYQNSVESSLEGNKRGVSNLLKEIEDYESELPYDERSSGIFESVQAEHDDFAEYFPNILRSTIIVQSFSFFEYHLKNICNRIFHIKNTVFQLNDLQGSDLEKARIFLERTIKIDIRKYNPEWDLIKNIQQLRNVIVHSGGEHKKEKQQLENFINNHPSLSVSNTYDHRSVIKYDPDIQEVFVSDNKLNFEFLKAIQSFFEKLCEDPKFPSL